MIICKYAVHLRNTILEQRAFAIPVGDALSMKKERKEEMTRKIQLSLPEEVFDRLTAYCDRTGMTKQSFIAYLVSSSLDAQEQLMAAAKLSLIEAAATRKEERE